MNNMREDFEAWAKERMKELENHWCGVGKNSPEHIASYHEWKKLKGESLKDNMTEINKELLTVLKELEESSSYWGEYDVPLGIHDRIKRAIANAQAAQPVDWLRDAVIVLEDGAEPMVGDWVRIRQDGTPFKYYSKENTPEGIKLLIERRDGKPVVYKPKGVIQQPVDTGEVVELLARAKHKWNADHLMQDQQDAIWEADKHQNRSQMQAALTALESAGFKLVRG